MNSDMKVVTTIIQVVCVNECYVVLILSCLVVLYCILGAMKMCSPKYFHCVSPK